MEVRDGFIVSIFNYCDRWCETCAFTSRCRVFADVVRAEASLDPNMAAVVHAPVLPQDMPPPPPPWVEEMVEAMNEAARKPMTEEEIAALEPEMPVEHELICERAMDYAVRVHGWLKPRGDRTRDDPHDPVSVIAWFATLNATKIHRALSGLAEFDGDREFPPDHEGSAKVALLGLERSHAAWTKLLADARVDTAVARRELAELEWLRAQVDAAIPLARAFVRPGFDESAGVSSEPR
jgi:hypothetical protein